MGAWLIPIVVTAVGTLTGTLTGKMTPASWLPEGPPPVKDKTIVRIWSGLSPDNDALAGHMPGVVLYDELGNEWGQIYDSKTTIPAGNFRDLEISPSVGGNNVRPTYLQLDAWDWNGICIATVEITYPDENKALIYSDVPFHMCDYPGYPSVADFPLPGGGSSGYHPFCIWLDNDDTLGTGMPKSIHFHIPDFDGQNATLRAYNENRDLVCKSQARIGKNTDEVPDGIPYFKPSLVYNPEELDVNHNKVNQTNLDPKFVLDEHVQIWSQSNKNKKKGDRRRNRPQSRERDDSTQCTSWVASESSNDLLSAEYLCGKPNVAGPHYANLRDGKFCNMNDRTVWDICSGDVTSGCFDVENKRLTKPLTSSEMVSNGTSEISNKATVAGSDSVILQLNTRIDMTGDS